MTILELADLVKEMEEKFGVSAAAPVVAGGAVAAAACTLISPFYALSAMGILPVHLCREETSEDMKILSYLSYPVLLLAVGLLSDFI